MKIRNLLQVMALSLSLAGLSSCGCKHEHLNLILDTATCVEGGVKTYHCEDCGGEVTEPSDKLGHDFSVFVKNTATCTESGFKYYKCVRCEETKSFYASPTGHHYVGCLCENCGEHDPDFIVKEMEDKVSFSEVYLLSGNLIYASLSFNKGETSASLSGFGNIYSMVLFSAIVFDEKGSSLGSDSLIVLPSYYYQYESKDIKLKHSVSKGEKVYAKLTATAI